MTATDFPFHVIKNPYTITATTIGLPLPPVLDGDSLTSKDETVGSYLEHQTEDSVNASAGVLSAFDVAAPGWQPLFEFDVRTPTDISNTRYWVGLFNVAPDLVVNPGAGNDFAAFRFEPSLSANWFGVSSNGNPAAFEAKDLLTAVQASTVYTLKVGIRQVPRSVLFFVNDGTPQTITDVTKIPDVSAKFAFGVRVTRLAAPAKQIQWRRISWTY